MKAIVLRNELSKILSIATRFTSTRSQLPILENSVIKTSKNKIYVMATNLENSFCGSIAAKISKEGDIAVPARNFSEILLNLAYETVALESRNETLLVTSNAFYANLAGMNTSDFPSIPEKIGRDVKKINFEKFSDMLGKVLFSVSRDETRPILTGVLFVFQGDSLLLVSSDGFRLSSVKFLLGEKVKPCKFIVPRNILAEISRFRDVEEMLDFEYRSGDNQVLFGFDGNIFSSRLIEGDFPDFEKIVPKSYNVKAIVSKEDLLRAIKLASVFARDSANTVKLKVLDEGIGLSSESSRSGSQNIKIDAKVEGGEVEITYNYRFIEDFLNVVDGDEVIMEFTDSISPGVFRDGQSNNFYHIIMPVKTQE